MRSRSRDRRRFKARSGSLSKLLASTSATYAIAETMAFTRRSADAAAMVVMGRAVPRMHSGFVSPRIVGLLGDRGASESVAEKMPEIKFYDLPSAPGERLRFREESTLEESEDQLFACKELAQDVQ